jgi:hypothetical protein
MWFDYWHRQEIFLSSKVPNQFWGPLSLLFNGYQWRFLWVYSGRDVKLNTHLHLLPRVGMSGPVPPLSLHGMHRDNFTFIKYCRFFGLIDISKSNPYTGPKGSRILRLPEFLDNRHMSALLTSCLYFPGDSPGIHFC